MHLIESQSLCAGATISTPSIAVDFIPVDPCQYITIQPFTKPAKTYDYWVEVLDMVLPYLDEKNIKVIQVGGPNEAPLDDCIHYQGGASLPQTAYIIKNSLLHVGVDSWCAHAAGVFNVPIVCVYSNNKVNNVRPYWGNKDKQELITCVKEGELPSYAVEEYPKSINTIKPEVIAEKILKLLNIPYKLLPTSLHFGDTYNSRFIEWIPSSVCDNSQFGVESMVARCDNYLDEAVLAHQLKICKLNIITNKRIDLQILRTYKEKIIEFIYIITKDNNDFEYVAAIQEIGIPVRLVSDLPEDEVSKYKFNYCDIGVIHIKKRPSLSDILAQKQNKLLFKCNKSIYKDGKLYSSLAHMNADIPLVNQRDSFEVIDDDYFTRDLGFFYIYTI